MAGFTPVGWWVPPGCGRWTRRGRCPMPGCTIRWGDGRCTTDPQCPHRGQINPLTFPSKCSLAAAVFEVVSRRRPLWCAAAEEAPRFGKVEHGSGLVAARGLFDDRVNGLLQRCEHGGSALRGPGAERRSEPRFDDLVLSTEVGPGVTGPLETDTARQTLRSRRRALNGPVRSSLPGVWVFGASITSHPSSPRSFFGTDHRPEHSKTGCHGENRAPHRTGSQVPGVSPATHDTTPTRAPASGGGGRPRAGWFSLGGPARFVWRPGLGPGRLGRRRFLPL